MRKYTDQINRYHTPGEWKKIDVEITKVAEHTQLDTISDSVEERAHLAMAGKFVIPDIQVSGAKKKRGVVGRMLVF